MAESRPLDNLVERLKVVLIGLEATPGTEATVFVPLLCYDPKMQCTSEWIERKPSGLDGQAPGQLGWPTGTFTTKAEFRGNGVALTPDLDPGLAIAVQSSGFVKDDADPVYTREIVAADQKTCSIKLFDSGRVFELIGAAGKLTFDYEKRGMVNLDFSGVWIDPTAGSLPEGLTYNDTMPPLFTGYHFTLTKDATIHVPRVSKVSLDLGNDVQPVEGGQYGISHYMVPTFDPKVTFDPRSLLVASYDVYGKWKAGTTAAMSLPLGSVAGNTITVTAPVVQYSKVSPGSRDGVATDEVEAILAQEPGDDTPHLTITAS